MRSQIKLIALTIIIIVCVLFIASMWYVILGLCLAVGSYYFAKSIRFIGGIANGKD